MKQMMEEAEVVLQQTIVRPRPVAGRLLSSVICKYNIEYAPNHKMTTQDFYYCIVSDVRNKFVFGEAKLHPKLPILCLPKLMK